jgi:hypothetical protein
LSTTLESTTLESTTFVVGEGEGAGVGGLGVVFNWYAKEKMMSEVQ